MDEALFYLRCKKCEAEKPSNISIEDYSQLNIAFTENKMKIICNRHKHCILVIDLVDSANALQKLMKSQNYKVSPSVIH